MSFFFSSAAAPAPGYLVNQNFETPTTGYDNGETWNSFAGGGTINPVYAVSPIVGAQSLRIVTTGANQAAAYTDFTASNNVYMAFRMRLDSFTGTHTLLNLYTVGAGARIGRLDVVSTGEINLVFEGGAANNSSTTLPLSTNLYLWFEYEKGTGSNAVLRAGWSTTSTKPTLSAGGATTAALTAGSQATQGARIYMGTVSSDTAARVYDAIKVDTSPLP